LQIYANPLPRLQTPRRLFPKVIVSIYTLSCLHQSNRRPSVLRSPAKAKCYRKSHRPTLLSDTGLKLLRSHRDSSHQVPIIAIITLLTFTFGLGAFGPAVHANTSPTVCSASADLDVTATPAALSLSPGATGTTILTVTPLNGFAGTVTLAAVNVDTLLTANLSPTTLDLSAGPKNSTAAVTTANTVTLGNVYQFEVNVTTTSTLFKVTTIYVHIPQPELGLSASEFSLSAPSGSYVTDTVNLQTLNGLTDASVALSTNFLFTPPSSTLPSLAMNPTPVTLSTSGAGTSTLTVSTASTTTPGDYEIQITGTTSPGAVSNSTVVSVTVTGPGFILSSNPFSLTIPAGTLDHTTINATSIENFGGSISLTDLISNPLVSITATFGTNPIVLTGGSFVTSILTIGTSVSTPPGSYQVHVTGNIGSTTGATTVYVTVPGSSAFSMSASPSTLTVSQGGSASTSTIGVTSLNNFADMVNLSIDCFSSGLSASLSSASVSLTGGGTQSTTLAVSAYSFTLPGSYSIEVTGDGVATFDHNYTSVDVVVRGPNFGLSTSAYFVSLTTGGSTTATITANSIDGFGGTIKLAASVFTYPPNNGLSATLSPSSLSVSPGGSASSTLTLLGSAAGSYAVSVTGTSWPLANYTGVYVTVTSPTPDFTITATPATAIADGTTAAVSTIAINALNSFSGTVTLSHSLLPNGLNCQAFSPPTVTGSGQSSLSCTSTSAGSYLVTITGTSGSLHPIATATFIFTPTSSQDFTISATTPVSFTSSTAATSTVTVTAENGFYSQVGLSATVSPSVGLSVSLNPQSILYGSGTSTATLSSSTPGSYTVTITGAHGSLTHYATVQVTVVSPSAPDFSIAGSPTSLAVQAGNSGSSTISISPTNGFTGTVTLSSNVSPTGPTATLSTSTISGGSGSATLTVNVGSSVSAGTYTVTVQATSGGLAHSKQIVVTVSTAASPTAPGPSTILGLSPAVFYSIIGVIIVAVIGGVTLLLRKSKRV